MLLPINVAYKFDFGNKQSLFPFVGAYAGYVISEKGVHKFQGESKKIKFADETKNTDFGLNLGLGYQYSNIVFKVQYNPGLTNLRKISGLAT